MTDKVQKIRGEIERLKSQLLRGACSSQIAMETSCKEEAYDEVLALLNSMQEEPASEDLERCVVEQMEADGDVDDFVRRGIDDIASKYAQLGAQWQKEQMIKDAVDGWVARDEDGDIAIFSNEPYRDSGLGLWTPARNAFLFPRKDEYPNVTWNSEPQKVKVIIIKE